VPGAGGEINPPDNQKAVCWGERPHRWGLGGVRGMARGGAAGLSGATQSNERRGGAVVVDNSPPDNQKAVCWVVAGATDDPLDGLRREAERRSAWCGGELRREELPGAYTLRMPSHQLPSNRGAGLPARLNTRNCF
jgi:hypothetical protein